MIKGIFATFVVCIWAAVSLNCTAAGFPNTNQVPGTLLSGLNAPQQGRTAIIAYHHGLLFTVPELPASQSGSDYQVRTWDISDPTNPVELAQHGVSTMPINAHGCFKSGDYLIIGPNWPPEAPWSFRANGPPGVLQRTEFPNLQGSGARGMLYQPWIILPTYWSYDAVEGNAELYRDNWQLQASWDHLGLTGVIGHPFIMGNLLIFASDQSRTGVATYDISDPTNPVLLDVLTNGGPGGYWPELWGGDGKLYIVFPYRSNGNGLRVVDVTDPASMQFVTDRPLQGDESMYVQFQDEYAFMGSHKVDMRTFESVLFLDGANTVRTSDGGTGIDTSQFLMPLGNLLVTGGVGSNQGMAIWAHQAEPDTRGPSVGYHIPRAGQLNYPVSAPISLLIHETLETTTISNGLTFVVRPLGGSNVTGNLIFAFNDMLTFTPDADLLSDTTYEVVLPAGGIQDAAGNAIDGYSFTFSTGGTNSGNGQAVVTDFAASPYPAVPGSNVFFCATAEDPENDPIEYRFDFGDGTPRTPWSPATNAQYAYTAEGHFRAKVQVRDQTGVVSTRVLTVTVATAPTAPFPSRSTPISYDTNRDAIWVVNPDNDTVTRLDATNATLQLEVPVSEDPRTLALDANGDAWVACHDADRLNILDGNNGDLLESLYTGYGSAPFGIAMSPDRQTAYVSMYGIGELLSYDVASRTESGRLALGPTPRAIAVSGDGTRVLVTRFVSPKDDAEIWDIDAAGLTLTGTLRVPKFGQEENRDTTASGRGVMNYLAGLTISPDGRYAWVSGTKANTERGPFFAEDLDQDNSVRNVACRIDLTTDLFVDAVDIDNSDSATSLTFSPLGDYLFVTLQGNNEMLVLDMFLYDNAVGLGSLVSRIGVGLSPQGMCIDPNGTYGYTKNFMERTVSALGLTAFLETGDITVPISSESTVASEALAPDVFLGKQIFYNAGDPRMSSEGYLSCATCHVDGGHDGRVWDFNGRGEGFRNTSSLRGRAGTGQGNVHWSANFDEIQDFENDIRGAFGGSGFLSDSNFNLTADTLGVAKAGLSTELDALAAYVASLGQSHVPRSPYRHTDGQMSTQALQGKGVFQELNCVSCHAGSTLTDSTPSPGVTLHDVGTLRTSSGGRLGGSLTGIDTPTLKGVWNSPPYFHDGSARTLQDVFRVAGGSIYQAEHASISGDAHITTNYVNLNNDDTLHSRGYARIQGPGGMISFDAIDGGSGGSGALELRYSQGRAYTITALVNGVSYSITPPAMPNDPQWRHTYWETARIEDVLLVPGSNNTIHITGAPGWPPIHIDDMLVTTSNELALAMPHRQVLGISTQDQSLLIEYLSQLDGQPENPAAASTYDAWVALQGLTGNDALPDSNTDFDMNPNFGEYYFDTDPYTDDNGGILVPYVEIQGSNVEFTVTFRRAIYALDSASMVQMSTNLSTWADLTVGGANVFESILDPDLDGDDTAELVEMRVLLPEQDTPAFFRLSVSNSPTTQ